MEKLIEKEVINETAHQCTYCWCETVKVEDKHYCLDCKLEVGDWHELI
jgi:hypothetical protein